jgi:type I restriction enzyme S subunit
MRQDLLGRLAMGSTHQTIYMPDIESIRVPLPPVEEQDQIVQVTWSKLKKLDELLDHLGHQIELLQERRQALITAAVTGQVPTAGAA